MIIRALDPNDSRLLVSIWANIIEEHLQFSPQVYAYDESHNPEQDIKDYMTMPGCHIYAAIENDTICGYILARLAHRPKIFRAKTKLLIDGLYVLPLYRKQGIARQLFEHALKSSPEVAFTDLNVSLQNEAATGFWKTLGFETVHYNMIRFEVNDQLSE